MTVTPATCFVLMLSRMDYSADVFSFIRFSLL